MIPYTELSNQKGHNIRGVPAGFSAGGLFAGKGAGNKRKLEQKIENGKPI